MDRSGRYDEQAWKGSRAGTGHPHLSNAATWKPVPQGLGDGSTWGWSRNPARHHAAAIENLKARGVRQPAQADSAARQAAEAGVYLRGGGVCVCVCARESPARRSAAWPLAELREGSVDGRRGETAEVSYAQFVAVNRRSIDAAVRAMRAKSAARVARVAKAEAEAGSSWLMGGGLKVSYIAKCR